MTHYRSPRLRLVVTDADPNPGVPRFFFRVFAYPWTPPRTLRRYLMNLEKTSLHGIDRARLEEVVTPIVHAHGAELVDVDFKSEQSGWVLRLYVEKAGSAERRATTRDAAIDLEMCAHISRDVSPALDVADFVPHRYHLEVSSPGIERPLKSEHDFVRFAGEKAKVKVHQAVRGQKVLVGILGEPSGGKVPLCEGSTVTDVALDNIAAARLVFEFGPAPKPGKSAANANAHPAQANQANQANQAKKKKQSPR